ncbi:MAG TPA: hypothetical protein VN260_08520 [Dissulfurispiraceae bacterium]|nr:hypothetical protein [Dissulfurispiraceae bacterium]
MKTIGIICIVALVGILFAAQAAFPLGWGEMLRTYAAQESEVTGTYTLILYGGGYSGDIKTVAILDLEGDGYTFDPYAPDFDYRVIKGLTGQDALKKAEGFVRSHYAFRNSYLSKVVSRQGKTIGFELRPLYLTIEYGTPDVLETYYSEKGDRIIVWIKLDPVVERKLHMGGEGASWGH